MIPKSILTVAIQKFLTILKYRKQVINNNYNNTTINTYYKGSSKDFYNNNMAFIARVIVESINNYPSKKANRITYQNIQELESQCIDSNGVILLASHYGNWELACSMLPLQTDIPCYGVYKPLKNKTIDQITIKRRSKHGLILVPMKQIGRTIIENEKNNKSAIYILIADQNPNSKNSVEWCSFLGVNTAWFNGPSKLHKKYNFSTAYMEVSVGNRLFEYDIKMHTDLTNINSDHTLIETYSQLLENQIKTAPQYWLWSHKRWKRSF